MPDHISPTPYDRLLTVNEVRERLGGLSRTWVYELSARGELPGVHIGRRRLFRESAVQAYIESLSDAEVVQP